MLSALSRRRSARRQNDGGSFSVLVAAVVNRSSAVAFYARMSKTNTAGTYC
jgi:hypothetical protein